MNRSKGYSNNEENDSGDEKNAMVAMTDEIPITVEDVQKEEEEIQELEKKRRALEDRVSGMEKDLGGLLRQQAVSDPVLQSLSLPVLLYKLLFVGAAHSGTAVLSLQNILGREMQLVNLKALLRCPSIIEVSNVQVTVVDINSERIAAWQSKSLPIYEPGLSEIVHAVRGSISPNGESAVDLPDREGSSSITYNCRPRLQFSTDIDKAIQEADMIFVCVNTPTKANGVGKGAAADLGFVEAATRTIAKVATKDKIVVEKSTVPCRTAQSIREILAANARPGVHFEVLSNPEFLAEGTAIRDLLYPDRVIIGSMPTPGGFRAAASLADVYGQWVPRERIITMNLWSSELSKLAANAMLAQRISSVNALSAICEVTGADVNEVSYACGLDSRIGPHMLKAGPGFGGRYVKFEIYQCSRVNFSSCFQKDIFNIVYLSESLHLYQVAEYWRAIINMNEHQKSRFSKRIISCLFNNLSNKRIAVLGFAFKKDTSDTRESPTITLVSNLVAERASVAIYDPKVQEGQVWRELMDSGGDRDFLKLNVLVCESAYAACEGADAVVVMTEWDEFSNKPNEFGTPASEYYYQSLSKSLNVQLPKLAEATADKAIKEPGSCQHLPTGNPGDLSDDMTGCVGSFPTESGDQNQKGEYSRLDWAKIASKMRKPMFVFDGRNMLDHVELESLGFQVEAIGKASKIARQLHEQK
ncbi:MAG: hypothetical protein Q9167_002207 [Letrouitia subvulpina]